jgi:hypothetical protein
LSLELNVLAELFECDEALPTLDAFSGVHLSLVSRGISRVVAELKWACPRWTAGTTTSEEKELFAM